MSKTNQYKNQLEQYAYGEMKSGDLFYVADSVLELGLPVEQDKTAPIVEGKWKWENWDRYTTDELKERITWLQQSVDDDLAKLNVLWPDDLDYQAIVFELEKSTRPTLEEARNALEMRLAEQQALLPENRSYESILYIQKPETQQTKQNLSSDLTKSSETAKEIGFVRNHLNTNRDRSRR